jgi:hypothetical protein
MKLFRQVLSVFAFVVLFSGTAYAGGYHHGGHGGHGGCGSSPSQPTCNWAQYSESFTTTDFSHDSHWKKYYFGFDEITEPGDNFTITGATLTVNTTSNGILDKLYAENNGYWSYQGHFTDAASQVFTLSSDLFDEVLDGIDFKAWFSLSSESITFAQLDVTGKYCPPAVSQVPVPAAAFLFAPALMGFVGLRRKAKKA